MTWLEFIIENFQPGTATEVAIHIEKAANEKHFRDENKTKRATVFYHLPKHTKGMIKKTSKRKEGMEIFENRGGVYFLKDSTDITKFALQKSKPFKRRPNKDKKMVEQEMNKYSKHDDMMEIIMAYAKDNFKEYENEYDNIIDFISGNEKDGVDLYEIKSYSDGIYPAVGQLKYYNHYLLKKYNNNLKINSLNIVGNFDLNEKFIDFLKEENIVYKHIKEFK